MTNPVDSTRDSELLTAVKNLSAGATQVVDAQLERRDEPDESYVLLTVVLTEPEGETWPADDFYEIRRDARALTSRLLGHEDVQLSYRAEGQAVEDDDRVAAGSSGNKNASGDSG